jgi:hypothetical protein
VFNYEQRYKYVWGSIGTTPGILSEGIGSSFKASDLHEVAGSNLGPDTDRLDPRFSWFPYVGPGKCLKLGYDRFLPHPL